MSAARFEHLQKLVDMDFTQMRALTSAKGGKYATDEANSFFINTLMNFFTAFDGKPNALEIKTYHDYMLKIAAKISQAEYAYYLKKYTEEAGLEMAKEAALPMLELTFDKIPVRMQYWAAADWGGVVRNPTEHVTVVKKLQLWEKYVDQQMLIDTKVERNVLSNSRKRARNFNEQQAYSGVLFKRQKFADRMQDAADEHEKENSRPLK